MSNDGANRGLPKPGGLSKPGGAASNPGMITRGDIIMLGLTAGVCGALIGGLMLGLGMGLVAQGAHIGLLLVIPAAPVGAVVGWFMARRLAAKLPPA